MNAASEGHGDVHGESVRAGQSVLDHALDAFIAMDAGGFVIDWNPQAQRTFGWSAHEAIGQVLADLIIPPRLRGAHLAGLRRFLDGGASKVLDQRLELNAVDRAGREFPVELTISCDAAVDPPRFYAFLHDISKRRLSERLLRAQSAISHVFAEVQDSGDAMHGLLAGLGAAMDWHVGAWWSVHDDADVLRCSSVWRCDPAIAEEFEQVTWKLALVRGEALPGRVWASGESAWTADLAAEPGLPHAAVAARVGLHAAVCVPVVVDGETRGAIEFYSTERGEPDHATHEILGTIAEQIGRFVSLLDQRAELIAKLQRLALTDDLTGLANRRAWQESLGREVARARRDGSPLCVAMLDIDRFKRFNDQHGHQAGDALLRETADAWRALLRAGDILARPGGDEFAVILPAWPIGVAERILERVQAATPRGQTCSAGLVAFDGHESADELVGRADAALYGAKAQGRARIVVA